MSSYNTGNPFLTLPGSLTQTKKKPGRPKDPRGQGRDTCESKTYFTVTQALILTLQKTTDKQTHEIMNELISLQEQMIKDYELDVNKKSTLMEWHGNRWMYQKTTIKKRTVKFPGTEIYLSCSLSLDYYSNQYDEFKDNYTNKKEHECIKVDGNTIVVKANFYMPQRKMTFSEEQLGEMMLEGEIFDCSDDIEELKIKDSITPAEKRARAEAKKQERELKKKQKELEKAAKTKTDSK